MKIFVDIQPVDEFFLLKQYSFELSIHHGSIWSTEFGVCLFSSLRFAENV